MAWGETTNWLEGKANEHLYQRLLDELQPDFVHIMVDGRIVKSGGMEVAAELEKNGYEAYKA